MDVLLDHQQDGTRERLVDWQPSQLRRVVARMVDGKTVQIGTAPNRDGALALARKVIEELERPSGGWPLVGDRMLRPEAIVSIDVVRTV